MQKKVLACVFIAFSIIFSAYGDDYVDLDKFATENNASLFYEALTNTVKLKYSHELIVFKPNLNIYNISGEDIIHAEAVRINNGKIEIPSLSLNMLKKVIDERRAKHASSFHIAAILIDPGHGGKDPGAIGEFGNGKNKFRILEKDVVLSIGKDVQKLLQEKWPDKQILITRDSDTYPSLDDRVDMANEIELDVNEAIIYVSIHANASFNKNANGFEVWYLNPEYRRTVLDAKKSEGIDENVLPIINSMLEEEYTTESIFLAQNILSGITKEVSSQAVSRGIRAEEWFVVRNAKMPSVLIEVGFVTNENEAKLLNDDLYLNKISSGIYNGIVDFVSYFEQRKGSEQH